jgi:hypothetical protein
MVSGSVGRVDWHTSSPRSNAGLESNIEQRLRDSYRATRLRSARPQPGRTVQVAQPERQVVELEHADDGPCAAREQRGSMSCADRAVKKEVSG